MDITLLLSNSLFNVCLLSWVISQGMKIAIILIKDRKFDKSRIFGAGGMPSSHSAVVCSAVYASLYEYGYTSGIFALAFVLASIVMYDATGVRRAAGLHAKAINNIVCYLDDSKPHDRKELEEIVPKLTESLGHRYVEVFCGATLGVVIALIVQLVKYGEIFIIF